MLLAGDALVVGTGAACFDRAVFCFGCSFAAGFAVAVVCFAVAVDVVSAGGG